LASNHSPHSHIIFVIIYVCTSIPFAKITTSSKPSYFTLLPYLPTWKDKHYNNRGLFCDLNIIANNKERSFWEPVVANHNSSQTLNLLRYHNNRTRTIASFSQLPNLIQSQPFSDYNCFYTLFAINITSKTICKKPIIATT
jgi:hypothetical protein